jgi:predicted transglutaminase-like cysteine proteinase
MLRRCLVALAIFALGAFALPAFAGRIPDAQKREFIFPGPFGFAPDPALFGTHEIFEGDTARFGQWTGMLQRSAAELRGADHLCAAPDDTHCTPREWAALVGELKALPLRQKIARANAAMNNHAFVSTAVNWHRAMYWETPFEFLARGGQCQDYAIAKYMLLRQAGVPAAQMRLVVLHAAALNIDHAVLAVYVDGAPLLLDNLRRDIVPASAATAYQPYYSINESGWWLHTGPGALGDRFMVVL